MGQDETDYVVKSDYRVLMNTVHDDHLHTSKIRFLRFLFDIDDAFHAVVKFYIDNKLWANLVLIVIIPLILYGIMKIVIKFQLYNPLFCLIILILLIYSFDNNYDFPMFSV